VAQTFDRDRVRAQVQELGGGDVTQQFRVGRTVCPGRFHLGVDEAVFCAAAWLGEEGLQLSSTEAAPQQAGRLREALERLIDAGAEGTTAAEATKKLADALQRVGSERRVTSPLGVAIAQARRLEGEIEAAERRLASFAGEEARLRELELEARLSAETAVAAQSDWIRGRLAQLDALEAGMLMATDEAAELSRALEAEAAYAAFPAESEAAVSALGGELHQAARAAAEAEVRWTAVQEPLGALRRRRAEISAGLQAMLESRAIGERETAAASTLRRRVEVSAAIAHRDEEMAATARGEALRREIAVTGLGGVDPGELEAVAPLVTTARTAGARARGAVGVLATVAVLGVAATGALAATGRHEPAALLGAGCLLVVAALASFAIFAFHSGSRARSELAGRLPGMDLSPAGLERLEASLPAARSLHAESRQQAALVEVHRAEQMRARGELEAAVDSCLALARESGLSAPARPPAGCRVEVLLETAAAALATVEEGARLSVRRRELEVEDARLTDREAQFAELGEEAGRSRATAQAVEGRIRVATATAGLDTGLPPLEAVAAFRDASGHRREHDRLAGGLAEARRRQRLGGSDLQTLTRRRTELADDLRRRGGELEKAAGDVPTDAAGLARLEREAEAAQERAAVATTAIQTLGARLEGLTGSLPSLADLEDERLTVTGARDRALHQQEALQRAIAMIETAGRDVHGRLAPRLAASVSERLALLTGDHYSEANVDMDHFAIALASADRDQLVSLDLVSHGTRDQVALLLRLALCEVLGDAGESMPLLLDEPLASADPRRGRGLLEFLAQLSATNQVVVTTSDPSLAAALVSLGDPQSTAVIDLGTGGDEAVSDLSAAADPVGGVLTSAVRARRPPARGLRGR
jgi:DNA repair exonuclease SbcCD ATPase subunit